MVQDLLTARMRAITRAGTWSTALMAQTRTLHDVFVDEMRDMYNAEQQITKALPG